MKKTYIIASTCILILGGVYFVQMYNKDNEYDDIYIEENSNRYNKSTYCGRSFK